MAKKNSKKRRGGSAKANSGAATSSVSADSTKGTASVNGSLGEHSGVSEEPTTVAAMPEMKEPLACSSSADIDGLVKSTTETASASGNSGEESTINESTDSTPVQDKLVIISDNSSSKDEEVSQPEELNSTSESSAHKQEEEKLDSPSSTDPQSFLSGTDVMTSGSYTSADDQLGGQEISPIDSSAALSSPGGVFSPMMTETPTANSTATVTDAKNTPDDLDNGSPVSQAEGDITLTGKDLEKMQLETSKQAEQSDNEKDDTTDMNSDVPSDVVSPAASTLLVTDSVEKEPDTCSASSSDMQVPDHADAGVVRSLSRSNSHNKSVVMMASPEEDEAVEKPAEGDITPVPEGLQVETPSSEKNQELVGPSASGGLDIVVENESSKVEKSTGSTYMEGEAASPTATPTATPISSDDIKVSTESVNEDIVPVPGAAAGDNTADDSKNESKERGMSVEFTKSQEEGKVVEGKVKGAKKSGATSQGAVAEPGCCTIL